MKSFFVFIKCIQYQLKDRNMQLCKYVLWAKMKNLEDGSCVQNISDLVLKEMYGIYGKKKPYKRVN